MCAREEGTRGREQELACRQLAKQAKGSQRSHQSIEQGWVDAKRSGNLFRVRRLSLAHGVENAQSYSRVQDLAPPAPEDQAHDVILCCCGRSLSEVGHRSLHLANDLRTIIVLFLS